MVLRLNQPVQFEELAARKVAIFDDTLAQCGAEAGLAIARQLAKRMDEKAIDDAFVVVNLDAIVHRLLQWRAMLPRIQPFYAVKCNNDPVLLRLLADLGCGFDCASRGEIDQIVVECGLVSPADRVIYANPCKTRAYICHAEQMGIRRMTFDSVEELAKIREYHSAPELILRIAVSDPTAQCPLAIKFGCDPGEEADGLLRQAAQMGMRIVGISFHVGSGCRDPSAFQAAVKASRRLFDLGLSLGHPMSVLDIGGGFPGHDTAQISFAKIVDVLHRSLEEYFPADGEIPVQIIAEPGRYFASAPISLCTNIISTTKVPASRVTKRVEDGQNEGQMLYVNDGIYGSFNCIFFDHFQPTGRPLFENEGQKQQQLPTIVWGQTCDGLDQIEAQTQMRKMDVGEWLYYENMGAYTSVAASHFNGFQTAQPFYAISEQCWNALYGTGNVVVAKEEDEAESGISSESEAGSGSWPSPPDQNDDRDEE